MFDNYVILIVNFLGYRPTPATVKAPPALVGDLCGSNSDCLGVPHSRCEGGACVCKQTHHPASDRKECLRMYSDMHRIETSFVL